MVGGGVIGVEYTCMFATLGRSGHSRSRSVPGVLEFADAEIVEALTAFHLRDQPGYPAFE